MNIVPGPDPSLAPRIIGLIGAAGSGKDTVGNFLLDVLPGEKISLASPFKDFAGEVFLFDENQLYGPSHFRNKVDERYAFDRQDGWSPETLFFNRYIGLRGAFTYVLDWLSPKRLLPPRRAFTVEEVERNRLAVWTRYGMNETRFLEDVLPRNYPIESARVLLRRVMKRIMEERNITPRLVLQLIGSEFGRAIDPNIWAHRTMRRAHEIVASGRTAVITDVRFVNEGQLIRESFGQLYYIENPVLDDSVENAGVAGHVSEQELRSPEMRAMAQYLIWNDKAKGLDHLRRIAHATLLDA